MREPGEAGPADEAIAYRMVLMGLHEDDPMGYSAMDDMFEGGKQRVADVVQVLAGIGLNLMLRQASKGDVIAALTQIVAEKTLEAEQEDS
ncbi:hypothetical protein [Curtobacterium sp. PhB136]|uniref:hypothetical protein n=1 Tax=Curtobacterium sp. PhB136 TaxID=2485181 RepID=UPI0010522CDB|nr:hypothetical protein [Curtobacterium sp. PhB136]TCK63603.1 hypothetical protein EDF27_2148 [Curtobacterium sp. PhB136]